MEALFVPTKMQLTIKNDYLNKVSQRWEKEFLKEKF